jgi:hypothetical protein
MPLPGFFAARSLHPSEQHYRASARHALAKTESTIAQQAIPPVWCGGAHWGDEAERDCVGFGKRQWSAILWGIPDGVSWEWCCEQTPHWSLWVGRRPPDRCINTGFNIWGEWDMPDPLCRFP